MTRASVKGYGPGCPSCGAIRSTCLENGWSEPNDNYLRRKRCNECDETFITAEVVVPSERTTFYRLDYRGRHYRRQRYREIYAKTTRQLPQNTRASDQLHVSIRVTTQGSGITTCMRGHPWTRDNTYVNPSSGYKQCRICRKATQNAYYHRRRAEERAA